MSEQDSLVPVCWLCFAVRREENALFIFMNVLNNRVGLYRVCIILDILCSCYQKEDILENRLRYSPAHCVLSSFNINFLHLHYM